MRFFLSIAIVYCFLTGCFPVYGQQLYVQKYPVEDYNSGQNFEVAQDKEGSIYVANTEGLLKYDSYGWELVPLQQNKLAYSLAPHPDGKIYLGLENDMGFLEKDSLDNLVYVSLISHLPDSVIKKVRYVNETKVFKDMIFFADCDNLFIFKKNSFEILDVKKNCHDAIYSLNNDLFLLGKDGLYQYENSKLNAVNFHEKHSDVSIVSMDQYKNDTYLALDSHHRLWIFDPRESLDHQLTLLQKDLAPYLLGADLSLDGQTFIQVKYLKTEQIVITTQLGVHIFDNNGQFLYSTGNTVFKTSQIESTCLDNRNNLWIATVSGIFQVITSTPLTYLDENNGLTGIIMSLGKKDNDLYVGTDAGIYLRVDRTKFHFLPGSLGETWKLYNFHQKLYAAHRQGVLEISGNKFDKLVDHQHVMALCEIRNQPERMIMGTYNTGIWLIEKQSNKWNKKKIEGFEGTAREIYEDSVGNIWISNYKEVIYKLHLNAGMDSVVSCVFYDHTKGLPSNINNRFYILNGKIMVTTADGIYSYDYKNDRFQPIEKFRQALGKNFHVYSLMESPEKDIYLWGATSELEETAGILKHQPNGTYKLITNPFGKACSRVKHIRTDVDAPIMAVNDREIWIGNNALLLNYNLSQETFFDEPYNAVIKKVWAKDSLVFTGRVADQKKTLPFEWNSVKFNFFAFFFEEPEKTTYQYKLSGFEDNWSEWTSTKEAVFNNLSEGNYTFIVRAKNIYGNISRPASYSFHISPPWYRTWWALLIYIFISAMFLALFAYLHSRRIRMQKARLKKEVEKKTKELHDMNEEILEQNEEITVINEELNLKNIEISKQAKMLKELNGTKDKLFSIISHDLRGPVNQLYELFGLLESEHVSVGEFKMLVPNMKEGVRNVAALMENLLHWAKRQMDGVQVKAADFCLEEVIKENLDLYKVPSEKKDIRLFSKISDCESVFADKDMIRLVVRNLVGNAIKFTPAKGAVTISSSKEGDHVYVSVKDTGIGMSAAEIQKIMDKKYFTKNGTSGEKGSGIGLSLCFDFVDKNGGSFSVSSTPGAGSTFTFSIPQTRK